MGPRTHDLLLRGRWKKGSLTVGVEAKADEPFNETLEKAWEKAEKELKKMPCSRKRQRLEELLEWVWRTRQPTDSLAKLRYQLLYALVGTAIQACKDSEAGCGTGVLLIHVFETGKTRSKKLGQNQRDLERFTCALPGVAIPAGGMAPGCLYGPATVNVGTDFAPSGKATPAAVYLAIIRTKLR